MTSKGKRATIPSIKPEQDEVASYRRSGRSDAPRQSNLNGLLVFVVMLIAIMMGIGGYTLYEVQKKLNRSNELLTQGQENIRELDSRLAATGTDVSKTLQDLKSQVNTNFAEIDKLWALAHRQNRPAIQENVRAIEKVQVDLGGKVGTLDASVTSLVSQSEATAQALENLREEFLGDDEGLITQIALLRGQVQDQAVIQEANKRNLAALTKRLKDTEDAIIAIDAHRASINRRLTDLQGQLQGSALPGSQSSVNDSSLEGSPL